MTLNMFRPSTLFLAILPLLAHAQITITQADAPQAGDEWTAHVDSNGDSLLIPTAGSSSAQTWDYVPAFGLTNNYGSLWAEASALPGGAQFPDAQLGVDQGGGSLFYTMDATGFYNHGSYRELPGFIVTENITGGLLLPWPFTYGDVRSGEQVSTAVTIFSNNDPALKSVRRNSWSITCDAFGNLRTPAYPTGTQVIRLLWEREATVDSTFIDPSGTGNGPWVFSTVNSSPGNVIYTFAQNGPMSVVLDVAADGLGAAYYSLGQPDAIAESVARPRQIAAYPVPAADDMVRIPLADVGPVRAVEVLDPLGGVVERLAVNGQAILQLSIGSLANGTYAFMCMDASGARIGAGRFVVAR